MELKRVVVTGMGALTPIGNTLGEYWDALLKGKSGAAPIKQFDASLIEDFVYYCAIGFLMKGNLHLFAVQ